VSDPIMFGEGEHPKCCAYAAPERRLPRRHRPCARKRGKKPNSAIAFWGGGASNQPHLVGKIRPSGITGKRERRKKKKKGDLRLQEYFFFCPVWTGGEERGEIGLPLFDVDSARKKKGEKKEGRGCLRRTNLSPSYKRKETARQCTFLEEKRKKDSIPRFLLILSSMREKGGNLFPAYDGTPQGKKKKSRRPVTLLAGKEGRGETEGPLSAAGKKKKKEREMLDLLLLYGGFKEGGKGREVLVFLKRKKKRNSTHVVAQSRRRALALHPHQEKGGGEKREEEDTHEDYHLFQTEGERK